VGATEALVRQWAEWQALLMAPIIPHWAEAVWELLGKQGMIVNAPWPTSAVPEDVSITKAGEYLFDVAHTLAANLVKQTTGKNAAKGGKGGKGAVAAADAPKPNQVNLYVAQTFPRWKEIVLELLQAHFDPATNEVADKVMKEIIPKHEELASFNKGKQVPQFAAMVRQEAKGDLQKDPPVEPKGASAFALRMPFDELAVLSENTAYLCTTIGVAAIHVWADTSQPMPSPDTFASAVPGKPASEFFHAAETTRPAGNGTPPVATAPTSAAPAKPTKMEYLGTHRVAETLNAAVNELAEAQPKDPYAWLATKMAEIAKANKGK